MNQWARNHRTGLSAAGGVRPWASVSLSFLIVTVASGGFLFASPRIVRISTDGGTGSLAAASCTTDANCEDSDPCVEGACVGGLCETYQLPDCVPCSEPPICPPVDIVFIADTSGSMADEAAALCQNMNQVVVDLAAQGMLVTPYFLGITETPAAGFDCLTDDVVTMLGGDVPGDAESCPFPDTFSAHESWGPATAIVAGGMRVGFVLPHRAALSPRLHAIGNWNRREAG